MSIKTIVNTALSGVLVNTWAVELPLQPTFPAIIFEINTVPEDNWAVPGAFGSAYDQHTIFVTILAKTLTEIETLTPLVDTALEGVAGYMLDGECGDADYEPDASVYAFFCNHIIRKPRY